MLTTTTMFLIFLAFGLIYARHLRERHDREYRLQMRLIRALRAEAAPGAGLLFRRSH